MKSIYLLLIYSRILTFFCWMARASRFFSLQIIMIGINYKLNTPTMIMFKKKINCSTVTSFFLCE